MARFCSARWVVAILLLWLLPSLTRAYTPPANSPLGRREHPRLLVTSDNLAQIRARLGTGGIWNADFQRWVSWADGYFDSAIDAYINDRPHLPADYGFLYITHPVPGIVYGHTRDQYGQKARELLLHLLTVRDANGNIIWPNPPCYGILQPSWAYDWVNPLFSHAEKTALLDWFKQIYLQSGGTNPFGSIVVDGRSCFLLTGIAAYGDGIDDAWAEQQLDRYFEWWESPTGVTRSERDLCGDHGGYSQGDSYAFAYSFRTIIQTEEAWRLANNLPAAEFYADKPVITRIPLHIANTTLPWALPNARFPGGRKYVLWKSHYQTANLPVAASVDYMHALLGVLRNAHPEMASLQQWLIDNRIGSMPDGDYSNIRQRLWQFTMSDRNPIAKSPSELNLPLSRATKDGRYIFRTGWDDVNDSYVTITFNPWLHNNQGPQYPGGFTIDRKGPQVIRQGGFSGHDWGAAYAGPANNLIFVDRSRDAAQGTYDDHGGQRMIGSGQMRGSIDFVPDGPNDLLGEVRYLGADGAVGRDVDYVFGDVTRSYNSTLYHEAAYNDPKVSRVARHFVYFRPAVIGRDSDRVVVFDLTATVATKFEKTWLFHTAGEPLVNGAETAGIPIRGGKGHGKWTYRGATEVTSTNTVAGSNGKVYLTPLLPESRTIVKVGGPNEAGMSWQQDSHEFETPYGVQGAVKGVPDAEQEQYIGRYRIEVIPAQASLVENFLNAIEVGDANFAKSPTTKLGGTNMVGARIGDRIALFPDFDGNLAEGDIVLDRAGDYRIHLAGLSPRSEYLVQLLSAEILRARASTAGTLYFPLTTASDNVRLKITRIGLADSVPPHAPSRLRVQ